MAKKRKLHMGPAIPTQPVRRHKRQASHRNCNDKGAPYHLADPLAAFASACKARQTLNLLSGVQSKNVSMNLPDMDPAAEAGKQEGAIPPQDVSKGSPSIRDDNLEDICSIRHTTSRPLAPSEPQESPARPLLGNVPGAPMPTHRLQPTEVQAGLEQEPPANLVPPPPADGILHLLCKRPRHLEDQHANLRVLKSGMASRWPRQKHLLLQPKQQDHRQLFQGSEDDHGYGARERLLGMPMAKVSAPLLHTEWHTPIAATKGERRTYETPQDTFAANGRWQSQSSEMSEELLSFQMDSQSSSPSGDSPSLKDRNPPISPIRRGDVEGPGKSPCILAHVPRHPTSTPTPGKTYSFMEGSMDSYDGNDTSSGIQMGNRCTWHPLRSTRKRATVADLSSPLGMNMSFESPELEDWLL